MIVDVTIPLNSVPVLSGYTGKLTSFVFTLPANLTNVGKVLWSFGDGTFSSSLTGTHVYNWPGSYNVALTLFDTNNSLVYNKRTVATVNVQNFITESIYPVPAYRTYNILAGQRSPLLHVECTNSWQSWPGLSASGYTLFLYASGSQSNRLNLSTYNSSKWSHIEPTWRFVQEIVNSDGIVEYIPISQIKPTTTELYFREDQNGNLVRCNPGDTDSIFVGTSSYADFYYVDDTPKNYNSAVSPIFLFISLDTTKFPDAYQLLTPSLQNSIVYPKLEVFQHVRAVIPIKVRYNGAAGLIFTSSGLQEMPISRHKWQNTYIPFFINLVDSNGNIVDNYPVLSINTSSTPTTAYNVVNVNLMSGANPVSAKFFDETSDGLPPSLSAAYRGFILPYESALNVTLSGSVTVYNPPTVQMDASLGWISQPNTDSLYKITPDQATVYSFSLNNGLQPITTDQHSVFKTGLDDIFSLAVAPSASYDINVDPYVWLADADKDVLSKISSSGDILATVTLSALLSTSNKLSPSSLALDSNNNVWMTLNDSVSTIKIDAASLNVVKTVVPNVTNVSYLSANVSQTFGGTNLVEPGAVDTDVDNNIWVTYTHPLCSFVQKYDGTTGAILSTFAFESGLTPNDLAVDRDNTLWLLAAYNTSINSGTHSITASITAQKISDPSGFGKFQYTFDNTTNITTVLSGGYHYVIEVQSLPDSYYNGRFLIESVSGNSVIVQPHPISWAHASALSVSLSANDPVGSFLQQHGQGSVAAQSTAIFTYSDRAYRITPDGSVTMVDGLFSPSYIALDSNKNAWISHHLTRVSRIAYNGNSIDTNVNVGSAQYVLESFTHLLQGANSTNYFSVSSIITRQQPNNLIRMVVNNIHDRVYQHIEGLACDTSDVLWVVNDFEGRLYYVPTTNLALSAVTYTDFPKPLPGDYDITRKTYQANGDWNGKRWLDKYPGIKRVQTITGSCTFDILPAAGQYSIAKVNENFDAASTIKSYRLTERLLNANVLFDQFIGQMVGDAQSDATTLGKLIYERIANYPMNTVDPETCDISALYSLCQELNIPIDDYQFLLPANLKRIFNLVSIKHKKLWGGRNQFKSDFNKNYSLNPDFGKNLGSEINMQTYVVTAGTNLILNQLYNNEFFLVTTMALSAHSPGSSPVTQYPLSAYDPSWGWGLDDGVTGANIARYYKAYTYVPTPDNTQQEGVIDWQNPLNTLQETVSSIDAWLGDDGISESLLDWQIRKGLGLFIT